MKPHPAAVHLVIGIPTFRRSEMLSRLLAALPAQQEDAERAHDVTSSVVVIDNDPAESARGIADEHDARYVTAPCRA